MSLFWCLLVFTVYVYVKLESLWDIGMGYQILCEPVCLPHPSSCLSLCNPHMTQPINSIHKSEVS